VKKIIPLIFAIILFAGCTQSSNADLSNLQELGDLPNLNVNGMEELGNLPSTNVSIDLGSGIPSNNPFPSEPII
jgi:hypothetical protein